MTKGLKDMLAEAIASTVKPTPVQVSDEAIRAMSVNMRAWSGWPNSHVIIGDPMPNSPYAMCDKITRTFTICADRLVLNPNRVLLTVTPFRLKQEAVLTGTLLHEAGHARHSNWLPKDEAEAAVRPAVHSDGTDPSKQTVALAKLMEEPRVEGLMARDADRIGATGLGWTMRASAAHLVPMTALSVDPNKKIMDLIESWALRAGRQYALQHHTNLTMRNWVQNFTTLLHGAIFDHLCTAEVNGAEVNPTVDTSTIIETLIEMTHVTDDRGPTMLDAARDVLALLFPETDPDEQPEAGGGCSQSAGQPEPKDEDGEDGESDEAGEKGEGNTEPEDEGSGTDPGAGDSGQDEAEPDKPDEDGDPTSEGDGPEVEDDKAEQGSDDEAEPEQGEDDGATAPSTDDPEPEQDDTDTMSDLAKALAEMEAEAKAESGDEAAREAEDAADDQASGAGAGGSSDGSGGWRQPTKIERETKHRAERFLRDLIAPSESSTVTITDMPSATVDGAALSAWKAGGQVNAPNFFRRTRRTIEPSPPVKIAVLVDVSSSMDELQKPSALLSWALASAALDLRNFAGRGQQIESCLIHWGSDARVIQRNGKTLPGIREWDCNEGTYAMPSALALVEEEIPGFFEITDRPVNRLLVQFTDWELFGAQDATPRIQKALAAGVNMVTIAPQAYNPRFSDYDKILRRCTVQRGVATLIKYNPMFPEQVWETASKAL